jgi:hypothetical protein
LDNSHKIITHSHWSCCGNTEKHSVSCLITTASSEVGKTIEHDTSLFPEGIKILRAKKLRSFSETFDPEVDSEFTDFDSLEASDSELSIEEYNNGPVVWSPSSSDDRKLFDSENSLLNIESLKVLENEDFSKGRSLRSALRSPHATSDVNSTSQSAASYVSSTALQRIETLNRLHDKFVKKGFSVDFSRLRSRLGIPPEVFPSERSVELSENTRPSVRLPDVSEEQGNMSKVFKPYSYPYDDHI